MHAYYDNTIYSLPAGRNVDHYKSLSKTMEQKEKVFNRNDETFKMLFKVVALNNNASFRPIYDEESGDMLNIANEMK